MLKNSLVESKTQKATNAATRQARNSNLHGRLQRESIYHAREQGGLAIYAYKTSKLCLGAANHTKHFLRLDACTHLVINSVKNRTQQKWQQQHQQRLARDHITYILISVHVHTTHTNYVYAI